MKKLKVGIVGGTGMVGQRFISLLENHPYFEVVTIAASAGSAGKTYEQAAGGRWKMAAPMPESVKGIVVKNAADIAAVKDGIDFVFCAVDMKKDEVLALEEAYARAEVPVVSNNSANRWTPDVPMLIPEINSAHLSVIADQKKRLGTKKGFICVKPNCSIQSYVPMIAALLPFEPVKASVCTYQAISGAGKNFKDWPEMLGNVIPYISGEEEKSEQEPLKVFGSIENGRIVPAGGLTISAQCVRVPAEDGHLATVSISFRNKPSKEEILRLWKEFKGKPQELGLPLAPRQFITYFEENDRPQTLLDREIEKGMGICAGRLREDNLFDYKFIGLSHNTVRGAAGGAVLSAELLYREGYLG